LFVVGLQHYKRWTDILLDVPNSAASWSRLRCSQNSSAVLAHLLHRRRVGLAGRPSSTSRHSAPDVHSDDRCTGRHSSLLQLSAC